MTWTARDPVAQLVTASLVGGVFESAFGLAAGGDPNWAYLLLTLSLSVTLAITIALTCAFIPGIGTTARSLPLAAWSGLYAWVHLQSTAALFLATSLAIFTGLTLRHVALGGQNAATRGLAVGSALAIGLVVLPRVLDGLSILDGLSVFYVASTARETLFVSFVCLSLLCSATWNRLRAKVLSGPSVSALNLIGLTLLALAPIVLSSASPWNQAIPALSDREASGSHPNMIVLVLDTVRADHLSIYGYGRETTPQLAAFLARNQDAVAHDLAHSNSTWTLPAHASLFTGLLASDHRIHAQSVMTSRGIQAAALQARETLAERLSSHGYLTACVFANSWLRNAAGLDRGFDWFRLPLAAIPPKLGERLRAWALGRVHRKAGADLISAEMINRDVIRFLDACAPGPCYVVANYIEAHAPYLPGRTFEGTFLPPSPEDWSSPNPADSAETLEIRLARYDEEILELDHAIGSLLRTLERRGTLDRSWLVITADHGEAFGEHGQFEHGETLYGEVTRIPLIVKPPRGTPGIATASAVGLVDLASTLALIGTGASIGSGRDLRKAGSGPVAIELFPNALKASLHGEGHGESGRAVVDGTLKLIEFESGQTELYDLRTDPAEERELSRARPLDHDLLRSNLPPLKVAVGSGRAATFTREDAAQLEALGYLLPRIDEDRTSL